MKFAAFLLAGAVGAAQQTAPLTRADADRFERKLQAIVKYEPSEEGRRTTVTEAEVNSYLKFRGPDLLPNGVTETTVTSHGEGRLSGRAVVDLDKVVEKRSRSVFDPATYLTGRLPVTASGVLHTRKGEGRFVLEGATVGGIPIPKSFLQEIVSYYTRSADHPDGVKLDDVFGLPANIREIQGAKGSAVVIQ